MGKLTAAQREQLAYQTEQKYGLPKGMLVAQLNTESSNGKNNYNAASGATGPMQFMPATAASMGVDPNDDTSAIDGAGKLMAQNLQQSNGNVAQAVKLYYAGSPKGIGPKSEAYAGTVAAHWNPDDAFDAAMGGNKQPVASVAPAQPAAPDNAQPDYDKSFDAAMSGSPSQAPSTASAPTAQPQEDPQVASFKAGLLQVAKATHSPAMVRSFVRDSGYDPDKFVGLDEGAKAGTAKFGPMDLASARLQHNTSNDLEAGFMRGAHDVSGTLQSFAAYEDAQHPLLASIDNWAHTNLGLPSGSGQNLSTLVTGQAAPDSWQALANANTLSRKAYDQNYDSVASGTGRLAGQVAVTAPVLGAGGKIAMAVAPEAVSASPAVDFLAGRGGTNLLLRAASMSTAGAGYGVGGSALTASSSDEPFLQHVEHGGEAGAILGPVAGAASSAAGAVANRIAPGVDEATAKLAQLAHDKFGITLDADQITNSPLVRKVSAMMNLNPINNHLARDATQRGQFTQAVGRTFGADSPSLTPEVMQAAKDRIGGTMNDIAARNPVHVDDTLMGDMADIESEAKQVLPDGEYAPIGNQLNNVITQAAKNGDVLSGEQYQALTRKGSPLDVASNSSNPNIRHYAIQVRGALDDALERSASPEDIKALQQARLAYKNMKTVEPLVSKSTDGTISPALLNNRVSVNFKNRAYQGAGELDDLAQIGSRFLTPPSTSGTPEGMRANRILEGAGTGGALGLALAGHALGYGTAGEAAGLALFAGRRAAGAGTNAVIKRVIQSQVYKNKLLNGAVNGDVPIPVNGLPPILTQTGNRLVQQWAAPQPAQAR